MVNPTDGLTEKGREAWRRREEQEQRGEGTAEVEVQLAEGAHGAGRLGPSKPAYFRVKTKKRRPVQTGRLGS